jgi:hypothetical protein
MTPEQFFSKNMKWLALALLILFLFKSAQSCNRNMGASIKETRYIHIIDSLNTKYNMLEKESTATINELTYELKLAEEKAAAADKRAGAVQSVAEKIRANTTTTVNVRGDLKVDTTETKKK